MGSFSLCLTVVSFLIHYLPEVSLSLSKLMTAVMGSSTLQGSMHLDGMRMGTAPRLQER